MKDTEPVPICLLIGEGSRIGPLLREAKYGNLSVRITNVVSHKKLTPVKPYQVHTQKPVGIDEAASLGFPTALWSYTAMRKIRREQDPALTNTQFSSEYFNILAAFLCQEPKPVAAFLLGWDRIIPESFLRYFKRGDGLYNVIGLHPALLPDHPQDTEFKCSDGTKVPVLRGRHDNILRTMLALEPRPATFGATMYFVTSEMDSGPIIDRVEVPVKTDDTFKSYDEKILKPAEEQLIVDVVRKFAEGKLLLRMGR